MSIKTSKRIALGVIASLVLAPFAVTPANAARANAVNTVAANVDLSIVSTSTSLAVGEAQAFRINHVGTATALAAGDDHDIALKVTSFPASLNGVDITITTATDDDAAAGVQSDNAAGNVAFTLPTPESSGTANPFFRVESEAGSAGIALGEAVELANAQFTPSVAGTYVLTVWADLVADGILGAGEPSTQVSLTATAAGQKTQAAISTASAATTDRVTKVAVASTQNSARVGVLTSVTPNFKLTAGTNAGGITNGEYAVTLSYALVRPTGSTSTLSSTTQTKTTTTVAAQGAAESAKEDMNAITFTPNVAGTYTINAWHDADGDGQVDNGEASGSLSIVVSDDAVALAIKAFNATALAGDYDEDSQGSLVQLTLTNGGVAASLSPTERIRVSVNSGQIELKHTSTASITELDLTTLDLTRDDFDAKGRVWLTFSGADATSQIITFDGIGGGVDSILLTQTISYKAGAGTYDSIAIASTMTTGVLENTPLAIGGADGAYDTDVLKATALKMTVSFSAADAVGALHIKDNGSLLTGLTNLQYSTVVTGATTAAGTVTVTLPTMGGESTAVAGTSSYQFSMGATLATDIGVVTLQTATDAAANTARDQASVLRAATGSSLTLSMVIKDQFKVARANEVVAVRIAGRNGHVTVAQKVSDANGRVSFTYTDAPLTGVVATQDVITFDQDNGTDLTYTVNFVANLGVSTVTLGGGNNSATGVAATTPNYKDIASGAAGASDGEVPITATVKDANGSILIGVPVTWTISDAGTKANVLSTTATTYTDASGKAETSVYAWVTGTYTVTAVSGGVTATVTVDFRQETNTEVRSITVANDGLRYTVTAKDRFGNPVPSVPVYAVINGGDAFFGTGTNSATANTATDGTISFVVAKEFSKDSKIDFVAGNTADITAKSGSYSSVYGQCDAIKGNADGSLAAGALDPFVAGTAFEPEEGVGASFDAAGDCYKTATVIAPVEPVVNEKPTLTIRKADGRLILSGTAMDGEGDIIIYVKRVGTTAWKERAKTLEVSAPGDFNGSIRAPKNNVVIRVKQEGTGLFSNQVIALQ